MGTQIINGLCHNPDSAIHLLCPEKSRSNQTFICNTEIGDSKGSRNGLQHLVEDHLEYLLDVGPLCVFKEFPCGNGGAVDFLAINGDGLVFLVEVKRAKDQRAKFDVVFQVLKYHCFPAEILQQLTAPYLESKLKDSLNLSDDVAGSVAERARTNIIERLMNPIIIVDEASYPLIAHAYSLALRDIDGELRVFEINIQSVRCAGASTATDLVYVRKYCSNDSWIGNECSNNRKPTQYSSLDEKLREIPDGAISDMVRRLLKDAGLTKLKPAKSMKCFAIIPDFVYFSFDPDGNICQGKYSRTKTPDNPYRIVAVGVEGDSEQSLITAGFKKVQSHDDENTYYVFDLKATTTRDELAGLLPILRDFSYAKNAVQS